MGFAAESILRSCTIHSFLPLCTILALLKVVDLLLVDEKGALPCRMRCLAFL